MKNKCVIKPLALILSLIMVCSVFTAVCFAAGDSNSQEVTEGTAVSSAAGFLAMNGSSETFHLTQDIDFGGRVFADCILSEFSGTIYGNGYTIKNFSINSTGEKANSGVIQKMPSGKIVSLNCGTAEAPIQVTWYQRTKEALSLGVLIGYVPTDTSKTLVVENVNVYANAKTSPGFTAGALFGGIIGYAANLNVLLTNVSFNGSMTIGEVATTTMTGQRLVGGIIGKEAGGAGTKVIKNCTNNATITTYATAEIDDPWADYSVGGVIGMSNGVATYDGCVNTGKVSIIISEGVNPLFTISGGIVGLTNSGSTGIIRNCKNEGEIECDIIAGGIVGLLRRSGTILTDNVNKGVVDVDAISKGWLVGDLNTSSVYYTESGNTDEASTGLQKVGGVVEEPEDNNDDNNGSSNGGNSNNESTKPDTSKKEENTGSSNKANASIKNDTNSSDSNNTDADTEKGGCSSNTGISAALLITVLMIVGIIFYKENKENRGKNV